jgi:hypothetical protein
MFQYERARASRFGVSGGVERPAPPLRVELEDDFVERRSTAAAVHRPPRSPDAVDDDRRRSSRADDWR